MTGFNSIATPLSVIQCYWGNNPDAQRRDDFRNIVNIVHHLGKETLHPQASGLARVEMVVLEREPFSWNRVDDDAPRRRTKANQSKPKQTKAKQTMDVGSA